MHSVVGERLEREVPRLPGSSQQVHRFSASIGRPLCTRHRAQPRAGAASLGVAVIPGAAQQGCPSLTHMDPAASVSSVSGALRPSGQWPGAGRPRLHLTALASCLADESSAGPLPLVSISLFTPLTAAEMAPYVKRLSRGQTVEGKFGGLAPPGPVGPAVGGGLPFCPSGILGPTAALGRPGFSWVGHPEDSRAPARSREGLGSFLRVGIGVGRGGVGGRSGAGDWGRLLCWPVALGTPGVPVGTEEEGPGGELADSPWSPTGEPRAWVATCGEGQGHVSAVWPRGSQDRHLGSVVQMQIPGPLRNL